ncbi:MAG: peptidoglycan hydrolase FlgJ [Pseudomonadota bacterium]|nr:peptidoglycan hydrolase FlgJ [Pseudomonadota bacterium]
MVARTPDASSSQQLAATGGSLNALRRAATEDPKAAIREVSKQFEALFMQELMKSMRATTMSTGLLENQATGMGRDMLDQQYAAQMSGQPGGLAAAIARQLERQAGLPAGSAGLSATAEPGAMTMLPMSTWAMNALAGRRMSAAAPASTNDDETGTGRLGREAGASARQFIARHAQAARAVAGASGIPADFMLAQAAHETGWGQREIRGSDGSNSHNLFGIKAGAGWTGPTVAVTTTEVIDGTPRKVRASFRAYASYEESFRDYARLIGTSPRYAEAMRSTGDAAAFAGSLQRAGYATDPDYAGKLRRVIETTRRLQRDRGAADITS